MRIPVWLLVVLAVWGIGCNRNMEEFVPGEEPRQPDLSKIFPAGAQAPPNQPALPPSPRGRGGPPSPADTGTKQIQTADAGAKQIRGVVEVAPELADAVREGSVLFVIVRTGVAGPPTAVKRIRSPKFPFEFSIGPEDRMIESMPFAGPLMLTARLDADGNAATQDAGDLQGRVPDGVEPGARGVTLTLDERL